MCSTFYKLDCSLFYIIKHGWQVWICLKLELHLMICLFEHVIGIGFQWNQVMVQIQAKILHWSSRSVNWGNVLWPVNNQSIQVKCSILPQSGIIYWGCTAPLQSRHLNWLIKIPKYYHMHLDLSLVITLFSIIWWII